MCGPSEEFINNEDNETTREPRVIEATMSATISTDQLAADEPTFQVGDIVRDATTTEDHLDTVVEPVDGRTRIQCGLDDSFIMSFTPDQASQYFRLVSRPEPETVSG